MFTRLIAFSMAVVPFFCWMGWVDGVRAPKETLSIIFLAVIIAAGYILFETKKAFNKYAFLFLAWCIATLCLSNYNFNLNLGNGTVELPANLIAYKSIVYIFLAIFSAQVIASSKIDFPLICKVVAISCIVMCLYCILQLFGFDEWFRVADPGTGWVGVSIWDHNPGQAGHFSRRIVGTVGNPSILGIFLSLCLPYCLYLRTKLGYISSALCLFTIAVTLSLTAYIASFIILLFISAYKNKIVFGLLIMSAILACIPILKNQDLKFMFNPTGRIGVLKEGFNIVNKKAITGMGLGSFEYLVGYDPAVSQRLGNQNWREAHCEPFQIWFETGFIGLGLILLAILTMFRTYLTFRTDDAIYMMASMIAFLVVSLTYFPMRISPLSYYGVITLGLLHNKMEEGK